MKRIAAAFALALGLATAVQAHAIASGSYDTTLADFATDMGGNAVVGVRYDATEIMQGVTEVLAYGTAVVVQKA